MNLAGKNYLIGGGAGFIGLHLAKLLHDSGATVTVVDDFSGAVISQDQLTLELPRANIIDADLGSYAHSKPLDALFHLASAVGPVGVLKYAGRIGIDTMRTTLQSIEIAKQKNARLVYVSTSEVYGTPGIHSEINPCVFSPSASARQEYALAKRLAETTIQNAGHQLGRNFSYQIVRPFNVTGPFQDPLKGFVAPRFVLQALNNLPLTIYGDGSQIRAFTHVADICDGLIKVAHTPLVNSVWNIGNAHNSMPISELAKLVIFAVGRGHCIHVNPNTIHGSAFHEANDKIPDASKATADLHWLPRHAAESIISSVAAFWSAEGRFKKHLPWLATELVTEKIGAPRREISA